MPLGGSRARPASPGGRTPTFALRSAGGRAVTASPSRVFGDGVPQVAAVDVWPEASGEEQFGVRGVPGEEVGRALLGAGPPQQVHVGQVGLREVSRELALCDLLGVEVAGQDAACDCGGAVQDLGAAAIVHAEGECQGALVSAGGFVALQGLHKLPRHPVRAP